jgi:ribosomal protein S18 acetylase RimI-like enzyme
MSIDHMLAIRQYIEDDKARVWALHNEALETTGAHAGKVPWDDDLHEIQKRYIGSGGEFLVGTLEGKIVAMGALRRIDATTGEIKRMRVSREFQRRGYGTQILIALEQRARSLGISKLTLDTTGLQIAAQMLYEKYGYQETHRALVRGFNVIHYEKHLSAARSET